MAYDPLDLNDLGSDKILTEQTMLALHNNPIEIAQRGVGAPRVQVPVREYFTTPGAGVWAWPDGVTAVNVILVGGGGGTQAPAAANDSTATYNGLTVTAGAGQSASNAPALGGTATNGDLNVPGGVGTGAVGGNAAMGYGAGAIVNTIPTNGGYGGGGVRDLIGNFNTGGGGACAIKRWERQPGLNTIAFQVGAEVPVAGYNSATPGIVIFEY